MNNKDKLVEQFQLWRYGMFIHYGLYSIPGRGEWVMCKERIPFEEYSQLAEQFNPAKDCVKHWIKTAKDNGMKYASLTARHHDGFCLFDTATTDYNSVKTACGRDLVREYVDACNDAGIGVGIYYSVGSWESPGFIAGPDNEKPWASFVDEVHAQLTELMCNYGKVDYLFYDGCPPPASWKAAEINAEIRRLQPGILISSRCGLEEDVESSENHLGAHPGKLWESCYTLNNSWGCNRFDDEWKSAREVVNMLTTAAHNGGNLLLNIGPEPDGYIQPQALDVLTSVGAWLKSNGEAIYGTVQSPFNYLDQEVSTGKGHEIFITLQTDYGPEKVITGIGNKVGAITLLDDGTYINFRQEHDRIFLDGLDYAGSGALPRVLKLKIEGKPFGMPNPVWHPDRFRTC